MSFGSILSTLFLGPLKLLFEVIFQIANWLTGHPGIAIIFLSLCMNVLVLPLYRRADAMQEAARDTEARLHGGVAHIKKTFSGNERLMMLQTYYRQNNYSPVHALRGSVSLLLEIPFFMAAYQFLSGVTLLRGVSFGPISDLSKPDGMLVLFGLTVNVLPVLMTLINFISSAIYLKGFPLKTKIQLYGMALFFLVFLYSSPSGLVFYWTLNNIFSLGKNVFYKLKHPGRVISVLLSACGAACVAGYFITSGGDSEDIRRQVLLVIGIILILQFFAFLLISKMPKKKSAPQNASPANRNLFVLCAVFLSVFAGLFIPATFLAASPQEYVDVSYYFNPLWYALSATLLSTGTFLIWGGVIYWLAGKEGKILTERVYLALCGVFAVDYLFFGTKLGILSSSLQYENGMSFGALEIILNILAATGAAVVLVLVAKRWPKVARGTVFSALAAVLVMSSIHIVDTKRSVDEIRLDELGSSPGFTLSKEGKNVIVIFLDRGLGENLPYYIQEKPELKEMYDGFTYYSNCISYGGHTNFGASALMGGYEYTPVEMNRRDTELLVDKHNEALRVMPYTFLDAGYRVTVCDAPYANYKWIPDLSIYDERPEIRKFITKGSFNSPEEKQRGVESNLRNFFCFGLMKSLPLPVQFFLYDSGHYHMTDNPEASTKQERDGTSKATGINQAFMEGYNVLCNLRNMTRIEDTDDNTFLFFYDDAPHEPMLTLEPDYVPAEKIDNTVYDEEHPDRFRLPDGSEIRVGSDRTVIHYHANMASLLRIGEWLDYLKQEGVYDNTRIIIVSDHGYYLYQSRGLLFPEHKLDNGQYVDLGNFFPLMMVKDFGAHGFRTDDAFMTNADTPSIAFEGLIENPVNPFTGKPITTDEKYAHDQFIISEHKYWSTSTNNGKCFIATTWAVVSDNLWDRGNWKFIDDRVVLKEHKMPE